MGILGVQRPGQLIKLQIFPSLLHKTSKAVQGDCGEPYDGILEVLGTCPAESGSLGRL